MLKSWLLNEAYTEAAQQFESECREDGTSYEALPPHKLQSGFSLMSLKNMNKRLFENLILELASLDTDFWDLVEYFVRAHRAGHKDHLYFNGLGHVHRSRLLLLSYKASKYLEDL